MALPFRFISNPPNHNNNMDVCLIHTHVTN